MALRDLIRKRGSEAAASARPAIPASDGNGQTPQIAKIAEIALANSPKPNPAASNDPVKPTPEVLRQFRFDPVEADIAAGHPADYLNRMNNMAWEFMKADGMTFADAIRAATEIVAACEVAACEAAYEDVQALWKRIMRAA